MSIPASELESHAATSPETAAADSQKVAGRSPSQLAIARFRKDRLSMVSFGIVMLYLIAAISSPILQKVGILDAMGFHQKLLDVTLGNIPHGKYGGASSSHWLGVEPGTGRDVLSRILLGITYSLTIAVSATILTIATGAILGIISGYRGGWLDAVVGRFVDLTLSFPQTLMLLALSSIMVKAISDHTPLSGNPARGVFVVVVLSAFGWPPICRVVRGQVLSLREREFVEAAKLFGASRTRIYFKEILPNLWAPLLVYTTLTMPAYISAEAALSYLGVGLQTPTPTLGNILQNSIQYSVTDPVFFFSPAVFLALVVVSFNLLGDGIRDALDPKSDR